MPSIAQTTAAAVLLAVLVPVTIRCTPGWWAGRTPIRADRVPPSWRWICARLWSRVLHGLVVSLVMLETAAASIAAAYVNTATSDALAAIAALAAVLWLGELIWARPRSLIPPVWRPDGKSYA